MEYEEFVKAVKEAVQKMLSTEKVEQHTFLKNNGIRMEALVLIKDEDSIELAPTCYLEEYYKDYKQGTPMEAIVADICGHLTMTVNHMEDLLQDFEDFEKMKGRIVFKVIRTESNKQLLQSIPHVEFLDLSIVFYCLLDMFAEGNATAVIYNRLQSVWNVSTDALMFWAQRNTPLLLPCKVRDMDEVIRQVFLDEVCSYEHFNSRLKEDSGFADPDYEQMAENMIEDFERTQSRIHMYVMTNETRLNGAACMFYKGFLSRLSQQLGCDFIILPSSIHEIILLPERHGVVTEEYNELVREINEKAVEPSEILSDHIYFYRRKTDTITM